ncbi:MAG: phosphoglucomutase/phosphomannomutase family protein [Fimbriimonadales bacterium]|jgi:phosphomannomutase|nr:phosphoglucomutase/phosphomannomutase family protein [Fimbriimonadales bacterium]GBC89769.1 Phosphoglucomutase [bacterium HR14]GIV13559.1 MAG: phosphoesterase [Fimbriimonadales bacterium]CUU01790.1 Phosphomannomutase [Armatimonadetes bacterium GBS]CUU35404.1 Phosphomannomutase [Armatimonadetes bacterium GXS]
MGVPQIKFGTEGWRGVIADDFTVANVRLVTHAIARHLLDARPPGEGVLVAYDCRAQSEVFAQAAAEVLSHHGFPVWLTPKPVSSPAAAYGVIKNHLQGAVMFTASHNPPIFHGIKFKPHYGGAALTDITANIEKHLNDLMADYTRYTEPVETRTLIRTMDPVPDYLEHVHQFIRIDELHEAPFRVVTDAMHGSGAGYLKSLISRLGIEVHALREERNPYFGGVNPEPIADNLKELIHAVRHLKAHIGIAIDGDGDRVGAVDEHGNFVDSHRIFAITLRHLVERRGWRGGVVKTFSVSQMIDRLCEHYGLPLSVTPIGFKFIVEKMLQEDILMGGEESGGIGITRYMVERDGVMMGMLLLEAMATSGKSLSELVESVFEITGPYFYHRIDAHFERSQMPELRERLKDLTLERVLDVPVAQRDTLDGIKHILEDGTWLLLRASGTEPVVRIYAEARTPDAARHLAEEGHHILKRLIGA